MFKKIRISLIVSNSVVIKQLNSNHRMHNLYANFVKILDVCKKFSANLVNELGNMPRPGVVPKFSDLRFCLVEDVVAFCLVKGLWGLVSRRDGRDVGMPMGIENTRQSVEPLG